MEIDFRRTSSAIDVASAIRAAAVEPGGATPPASIAAIGIIAALHIGGWCAPK
jgi:hypothetical protein